MASASNSNAHAPQDIRSYIVSLKDGKKTKKNRQSIRCAAPHNDKEKEDMDVWVDVQLGWWMDGGKNHFKDFNYSQIQVNFVNQFIFFKEFSRNHDRK